MRIVELREVTLPIANAYIDFSKMTRSLVAVVTDGVRVESGYVTMPDLPGIGFEGNADLIKDMRGLAQ